MSAQQNLDVLNSLLSSFAGHPVVAKPRPGLVPFKNFLAEAFGDSWAKLEAEVLGATLGGEDGQSPLLLAAVADLGTPAGAAGAERWADGVTGQVQQEGEQPVVEKATSGSGEPARPGLGPEKSGTAVLKTAAAQRPDAKPLSGTPQGGAGVATNGVPDLPGVLLSDAAQGVLLVGDRGGEASVQEQGDFWSGTEGRSGVLLEATESRKPGLRFAGRATVGATAAPAGKAVASGVAEGTVGFRLTATADAAGTVTEPAHSGEAEGYAGESGAAREGG
ncbi:MAG: hypothetical protein GXO73_02875, partial [Calditrichaeota bacterium]|nr:hypothetical protein [Calditrichota bacterium]